MHTVINPVNLAFAKISGIVIFAGLLVQINRPISNHMDPQKLDNKHSWLALGDSYTIGESVREEDRYPVQTAALLGKRGIFFNDPELIARTGWTTADLLAAVEEGKPNSGHYDLVTLLIGVNNQFQSRSQPEYRAQFILLLKRSIALASNRASHVIVLSIPDYSVTPFASNLNTTSITKQIDSFNGINKAEAMNFGVNYLDITPESRKGASDPSLIAEDGLHFSGKEYAIWAKMLADLIQDRIP